MAEPAASTTGSSLHPAAATENAGTPGESPVSPITANTDDDFADAVSHQQDNNQQQEQQQQQHSREHNHEDVSTLTPAGATPSWLLHSTSSQLLTSTLASTSPSAAAAATSPQQPPSSSSLPQPRSMPVTSTRQQSEALGPATDAPISPPTTTTVSGPTLSISLMLTTGARHPYKIDEKYLRNRKVEAKDKEGVFNPREISGYQLKELIWTDWRAEWEPRPVSPSSIRLIILGRMIEDKSSLKDFPFNMEQTNVIHMTVKPADLIDDDDTAGKATGKAGALRMRDSEDRGAGCRCVIL